MNSIKETNQTFDIQIDLINFKYQLNKEATLKSLMALAGLVTGVVALIFLSFHFVPFAIGAIVISSYSLYHQIENCLDANRNFNRGAQALLGSD